MLTHLEHVLDYYFVHGEPEEANSASRIMDGKASQDEVYDFLLGVLQGREYTDFLSQLRDYETSYEDEVSIIRKHMSEPDLVDETSKRVRDICKRENHVWAHAKIALDELLGET